MAEEHSIRQAKLLTDLVERKIEARISELERTVTRMFSLFKKMKESSSPRKMARLERDVNTIREALEEMDLKSIEADIFKRFNKLNGEMAKALEEQRKTIENTEIELNELRKGVDDFHSYEKGFINLDTEKLLRDMEALKTKTEWIELEVEKMNFRPLIDKMSEIEAMLNKLKLSHPMIIE